MDEAWALRVAIDINVPLDLFLGREPWLGDARAVWSAHHRGAIVGQIAAHGLTNIFSIARRIVEAETARAAVGLGLQTFENLPIGRVELEYAHSLDGRDFEDNLVTACASSIGLDAIVTRDPASFRGSPVPVLSPVELLARLPGRED